MKITVKRIAKKDTYTIGRLYIDGLYFCDTLEDRDRGLTSTTTMEELKKIKVQGKTAIPTGTYSVVMNIVSPKFSKYNQYKAIGGKLPRLVAVPGYEGVLIHIGNTDADTDGCILVGKNSLVGKLTESTTVFNKLYQEMLKATSTITITIQ